MWVFKPGEHKTQHHGHERIVLIGPKAQEVLRPFLAANREYVFSARASEHARNAARRAQRKSPLTPSQAARRPKPDPKRAKRERYDETSLRNAVYRACDRAFPPPAPLTQRPNETGKMWAARLTADERTALDRWRKEHRWHPNQLRHAAATRIRKEHGIEAARVILGHSKLTTTEVYAEADRAKATTVMAKTG